MSGFPENLTALKRPLMLLSVVLCLLVFEPFGSGLAQRQRSDEVHNTYDLAAGGSITVTNSSGYIRITTWDENRVRVDAVKSGPAGEDLNRLQIQINATPGAIVVRTLFTAPFNLRQGDISVNYDLKVPRTALLDSITSINGEVTVTGPVAGLTASSRSGSLTAQEVRGPTSLNSVSGAVTGRNLGTVGAESSVGTHTGSIVLEHLTGRTVARSMSGSVTVTDVAGDVEVDSTAGSVTLTNVRGRVVAGSQHGGVAVRGVQDGVTVRGVSGSIEVTDAKGRVVAITTSGSITFAGIESREVQAKSTSGRVSFQGGIMRDGRYSFETFSGEIVIIVPPESNFNLTAKTFNGSINTEFPLQINPGSISGERQIRGTAGKGGAEIITVGFSGRIQIKKATGQPQMKEK